MNNQLKKLVREMICFVPTKTSFIPDSEEMMTWIPIMRFEKKDFYVGVLEDGRWVMEGKSGLCILHDSKSYYYLVAFLEQPLKKVRENLLQFFERFGIVVNVDEIFPFVEIVKAGFEYGTEYWMELAFEWYCELPIEKKNLLNDSLYKIVERKMGTQKLRHHAIKELKRANTNYKPI